MSLKASAWAWEQPCGGMPKLVLLAIADYANRDNDSAWPSVETLATRCGVNRTTVIRALKKLTDDNLVQCENRPNRTNVYHLKVDSLGSRRATTIVAESDCHSRGERPPQSRSATLTYKEPVKNQLKNPGEECYRENRENRGAQTRGEEKRGEQEELVKAIYDAYPRKVNKPAALVSIAKTIKREATKKDLGMSPKALLEKTKLWATAVEQRLAADPDSRKFIKHPATWFNQQCYLEDTAEWGIKPNNEQKRRNREIDQTVAAANRLAQETLKALNE